MTKLTRLGSKYHELITEGNVNTLLIFRMQLTVPGIGSHSEPSKCDVKRAATTAYFTSG